MYVHHLGRAISLFVISPCQGGTIICLPFVTSNRFKIDQQVKHVESHKQSVAYTLHSYGAYALMNKPFQIFIVISIVFILLIFFIRIEII